ncbi:PQQ-binding-like beta-propeller repeat protein [Promicromonospora sukumoe]|uniref:outer membrane protein assembly factor BamB family protein n=1 Tax=Promicromonospora sukumoe TaxID=88382 RepID=UPI00364FE34D
MTERTQPDPAAPGSSDPEKVHTFELIDEVPGASRDGAGPDGDGPDGPDPADDGAPEPAEDPEAEPAPREPGRVAVALAGARSAAGRTARRGGAAVRRRLPTTRRGKVLLAGGTAAVVVLAVVGGVLVDAELRHRALLAAPGGVRSLAEKPTEQWSIELDNPISSTLVGMPGVLAVVGDSKVRGVDPATGEVRWTVDTSGSTTCGPLPVLGIGGPAASAVPADPLVCVTASGDGAQVVTTIDRDGAATTRELDADAMVLPAPGGGLIHLELSGGEHEQEPVVVDKVGTPHLPKGFVAPDLTVSVEDASTGTERWSAVVAAADPDVTTCLTYNSGEDDPDVPAPVLDVVGSVYGNVQHEVLRVDGCGIAAAFLLDGTRLDDPEDATDLPEEDTGEGSYASLPDGGWVGPDRAAEGTTPGEAAHLPDGRTVPLGGQALVPWATDGRDPGLLLVRAGVHTEARSTDERDAGEVLWSAPRLRATDLLARVAGTAVVVDELGPVRAVDLGTGAERWTLDPEVLGVEDLAWGVESMVFGAWTDGDTLLLPVSADPTGESSGLRLLAIDLRDGSLRWEIDQETPYTQLIAVDGYLAQITQQGVVGLG